MRFTVYGQDGRFACDRPLPGSDDRHALPSMLVKVELLDPCVIGERGLHVGVGPEQS